MKKFLSLILVVCIVGLVGCGTKDAEASGDLREKVYSNMSDIQKLKGESFNNDGRYALEGRVEAKLLPPEKRGAIDLRAGHEMNVLDGRNPGSHTTYIKAIIDPWHKRDSLSETGDSTGIFNPLAIVVAPFKFLGKLFGG